MTTVLEQVHTDSLDAPTPCRDWNVRELLRHVVRQNLRNFTASRREAVLRTGRLHLPSPETTRVEDYRQGAHTLLEIWRAADLDQQVPVPSGAQAALRSRADHQITELCPRLGPDQSDASIGLPDEEITDHALTSSRQMLQPQFRGEGKAFGEETPVPADAPAYERLAGWFGRDPYWQPPEPATR